MKAKDILSRLDKPKREIFANCYSQRVKPANNGGIFLSPSEFNACVNDILSSLLGETVKVNGITINAIVSKLVE
jgi:hypothetical protein